MLTVTYDETLTAPNTWNLHILSDGRALVVTRCTNGHIGSLVSHDIADDGTVSPSVVCQKAGCNFHEFIRLDGWQEHAKGINRVTE